MSGCPSDLALARAIEQELDDDLAGHVEPCASCRAAWQDTHDAIAWARVLPIELPARSRLEELRTALLATPPRAPRPTEARRP